MYIKKHQTLISHLSTNLIKPNVCRHLEETFDEIFYPYIRTLGFACSFLIFLKFFSISSASLSREGISHDAPGTSLLIVSETGRLPENLEDPLIL